MDNTFKIVTNNDGLSIIINPDKKPVIEWRVYWDNNLWTPKVRMSRISFVPDTKWRYQTLNRLTQSEYVEGIVNNININSDDAATLRLLLGQYVIAPYTIDVPSLESDAKTTVFKSGEKDWRLLITQGKTTQTVFLDCINHGTFTFYNGQQIDTSAIAAFNELVYCGTIEYLCDLFESGDIKYDDSHLCLYFAKLMKQGFEVALGTLDGIMVVEVRVANRFVYFGVGYKNISSDNDSTRFVPLPGSVVRAFIVLTVEEEE